MIVILLSFTSYEEPKSFKTQIEASSFCIQVDFVIPFLCSGNSLYLFLISTFHIKKKKICLPDNLFYQKMSSSGETAFSYFCVYPQGLTLSHHRTGQSTVCQVNGLSCINTHLSIQPPGGGGHILENRLAGFFLL